MPIIESERYAIEPKPLGRGGFGEVYLANDLLFDRQVVIKVISAASIYGMDNDKLRRRFFREAALSAKLGFKTPYVVKVYDYGYDRVGSLPFFVLEYLPEGDLRKYPGRFAWSQAGKLVHDILTGLVVAHENGVVHSDISPDNILVSGDIYKLNDFGLAKLLTSALMARSPSASMTGGKPAFLPLEQWLSGERNEFSDLYGLAVTLIYLISGHLPRVTVGGGAGVTLDVDGLLPPDNADEVVLKLGVFDGDHSALAIAPPKTDGTWFHLQNGQRPQVSIAREDIAQFIQKVIARDITQTKVAVDFFRDRGRARLKRAEELFRNTRALQRLQAEKQLKGAEGKSASGPDGAPANDPAGAPG